MKKLLRLLKSAIIIHARFIREKDIMRYRLGRKERFLRSSGMCLGFSIQRHYLSCGMVNGF